MNYKKYLISFGSFIGLILILSIILTIFSYTGLFKEGITNIFEGFNLFISAFLSSIILGYKTNQKGYLEGIKIASIIVLFLFGYNLIFGNLNYILIFYYILIYVVCILGSIIGINSRK